MAVAGCDLVLAKFAAIAPPALMAVAPPAVAVAPAPAGVPVAAGVPIAAPRHKISFSADAMFAFDKSDLKPEGKTMLEGLVQQIKSASYENIVLTGHADRIGSEAYNQKLSERRADAVKQFLADSGIVVGRIDTSGHGEKEPQTATGTCPAGQSAKAIACLQPDRRVDVEMQGTAP
jgi:OOP family OmpA-OmpF porin